MGEAVRIDSVTKTFGQQKALNNMRVGGKFKGYKDTVAKLETLKKASEGAVFGGAVGRGKDATIMAEGAGMKPTLGRYEVEKELGRG